MDTVLIPGTSLRCSRCIFGTATLLRAGSTQKRLHLLLEAVEQGFTHFDTAPYYGFGIAERDLSSVLRQNAELTVTTKVGVYSPGGERQSVGAVYLRKTLGRLLKRLVVPTIDFSVARARRALDASLERLGRNHIDLYLLHEPSLELVCTDEWQRWLETELAGGRVRHVGLAARASQLVPFLSAAPRLSSVAQVLDSLDRREADVVLRSGRPLQITYGYVSAAKSRSPQWSTAQVLEKALCRNSEGAVIVSTTQPQRLAQYRQLTSISRADEGLVPSCRTSVHPIT